METFAWYIKLACKCDDPRFSDKFQSLCPTGKEVDKFTRCVRALHANIMESYLDWCEHVRLPARLPGVQYSSLTSNTRAPVRS